MPFLALTGYAASPQECEHACLLICNVPWEHDVGPCPCQQLVAVTQMDQDFETCTPQRIFMCSSRQWHTLSSLRLASIPRLAMSNLTK